MTTTRFSDPECFAAAARLVQREWGETGYVMRQVDATRGAALFEVRHFDGSEFHVAADRWGNTDYQLDGETASVMFSRLLRASSQV